MKTCSICKRCFEDTESMCIERAHGELDDARHEIDVVRGYRIERVVGEAPNVSIYQALNLAYGQVCFLAIAEADTARFLADAKIAAGLFCSGIAGVIETGELAGGSAFVVSEGLDGRSLRDMIADEDISLLDAIVITRGAAEAVQELHAAGLVHGAVTPSNISVRRSDDEITIKLHNIDFGSAFATSALSNRFAMQSALPILPYLAPEQFNHAAIGPSADVYALGVLLYELLSGHPPFVADSASVIVDMQLHHKPADVAIENFDLRMLLTHTISEALQKQPSFRQSTADLFARQMRHIEQLATHVSTPPPAVHVTRPQPVASNPIYMRAAQSRDADATQPRGDSTQVRTSPPPAVVPAPETARSEIVDFRITADSPTFIPSGTIKRSRLKGMKRRLHTQLSRSSALVAEPPKPASLIEWQQPEDDIPSLEAVHAEREITAVSPLPPLVNEEVTAVRPAVQRLEVDLTKPSAATSPPDFLPTLLSTRPVTHSGESLPTMFAAFQSVQQFRKLPVYSAIIAIVALAGVSLMRIADRTTAADTGFVSENDTLPVQAPPIRIDARMTESRSSAVVPVESDEPEVAEAVLTTPDRPMPKRSETTEVPIVRATKETPAAPKPTAVASKQKRPETIVPSTLVISTRGGHPTRTILEQGRSEQQLKPRASGTGATRPRIVGTPD